MRRYLFIFSQAHAEFRLAEFGAVCSLFGIKPAKAAQRIEESYFVQLEFEAEDFVHKILSRATLLKAAYEILFEAGSHEKLSEQVKRNAEKIEKFNDPARTWCLRMRVHNRSRENAYLEETLKRYTSLVELKDSKVNLGSPDHEFNVVEYYAVKSDPQPANVYFCRLLCFWVGEAQGSLKTRYNLKDRKYIGNSTMDPEMSFIQANLAKVQQGDFVLDPFCGTGGLIIAAAHFGAQVLGTEIDYQIARAVGRSSRVGEKQLTKEHSVRANFEQYGLHDRFLGILIGDTSRHGLWRADADGYVGAIVADPPYGVREKGRKVGNKKRKAHWTEEGAPKEVRFPEKTVYNLSSVFLDLLDLSAKLLRIGGRIAFWFPVLREEYSEDVLPTHPSLELVFNCEQTLTKKSSRRLLVYEKRKAVSCGEARATVKKDCYQASTFRDKIFAAK